MRWRFLTLLCLSLAQQSCASPEKPIANPKGVQRIYEQKIKKILSVPSKKAEGRLYVTNSGEMYFYDKNTLWRAISSKEDWKILYEYKPKSLNDSDMNAIEKILITPSNIIWLVFMNYILKSSNGGQSWDKINPPIELISDFSLSKDSEIIFIIGRNLNRDRPKDSIANLSKMGCAYTAGNGNISGIVGSFISFDKGVSWEGFPYPCEAGYIEKLIYLDKTVEYFLSPNALASKIYTTWKVKRFKDLSCNKKKTYSSGELNEITGKEILGEAITNAYFIDNKVGWMCVSNGDLLFTENGGNDWCKKADPAKIWINNTESDKGHFIQIIFTDINNGVALDNDNTLFVTNNGGQDMKIVPFDFPVESFSVAGKTCWFTANKNIYQFDLIERN